MNTIQSLTKRFAILCVSACCLTVQAADEPLTAETFIDAATAKGIAEIEAGHLALRESSHSAVQHFARAMVSEHGAINRELIRLAKRKNMDVANEAELINQAKLTMLKVREGESFDIAYARNQLTTHEEMVRLFQKAVFLDDRSLQEFAEKSLPELQQHLAKAQQLLAAVTPEGMELPPTKTFDAPAHNPTEEHQPTLQPAPREMKPGEHHSTQPLR